MEMNRVLVDGVLFAAHELYGLSFKERKDLPTYQEDVRVFEVFDSDGSAVIGSRLADPTTFYGRLRTPLLAKRDLGGTDGTYTVLTTVFSVGSLVGSLRMAVPSTHAGGRPSAAASLPPCSSVRTSE